jgi:hypothetical protein
MNQGDQKWYKLLSLLCCINYCWIFGFLWWCEDHCLSLCLFFIFDLRFQMSPFGIFKLFFVLSSSFSLSLPRLYFVRLSVSLLVSSNFSLSFLPLFLCHCLAYISYGFPLAFWYLQTFFCTFVLFLLVIASLIFSPALVYLFGIIKFVFVLSSFIFWSLNYLYLVWLLITPFDILKLFLILFSCQHNGEYDN